MDDLSRAETRAQQASRRAVTRAAAWSVPVIALAVAAPAHAASPPRQPPGLNGWVSIAYMNPGDTGRIRIQSRAGETHEWGTFGLWVTNTTPTSVITSIRIEMHTSPSPGTWSTTPGSAASAAWTVPVRRSAPTEVIDGVVHSSYVTSYRLTSSIVPSAGITQLVSDMDFRSSELTAPRAGLSQYLDRYVTVDGVELAFRRKLGTNVYVPLNANTPPNGIAPRSARVAPEPSEPRSDGSGGLIALA